MSSPTSERTHLCSSGRKEQDCRLSALFHSTLSRVLVIGWYLIMCMDRITCVQNE